MKNKPQSITTLLVTVDTDPSANPNVTVDPDELIADGEKLRWIEAENSPNFDFISIDLDRSVFSNPKVSVNKRRIWCDNTGRPGTFEYEITVKRGGKTYNTTKRCESADSDSPITGGKPVIRNQ
jgi:hypothetical protein